MCCSRSSAQPLHYAPTHGLHDARCRAGERESESVPRTMSSTGCMHSGSALKAPQLEAGTSVKSVGQTGCSTCTRQRPSAWLWADDPSKTPPGSFTRNKQTTIKRRKSGVIPAVQHEILDAGGHSAPHAGHLPRLQRQAQLPIAARKLMRKVSHWLLEAGEGGARC
jgi:hypothetical protein